MEYVLVKWVHDYPDEPVWLYSEIDDERRETRKVYLFADSRAGWADDVREVGGVFLGTEPMPTLDEIAADPGEVFEPKTITKEEFERVWKSATSETTGAS